MRGTAAWRFGRGGGALAFAIAALALLTARPAAAATMWSFTLPGTATASQTPPYPTVATLTLTQTVDGVQFLLDPNENSPGFLANAADGFVERIDFAYDGPTLSSTSFRNDDGDIAGFSFESNPNNMDAGYTADVFHIVVDFPSKNDAGRFNPDQTREWTILGATLDQFIDTSATANSKPTPIYGVISVTAYSLPDVNPTPSNWVALVPEPTSSALLIGGLAGLAVAGRGRRGSRAA